LDTQRNDIVTQLQSIKSTLDILNRSVSIIDTNNKTKEEQEAFDETRGKITSQEESFLKIYDTFTSLIIPTHIADTIDTEKLYPKDEITQQIQDYFKSKYDLDNKEDTIPE